MCKIIAIANQKGGVAKTTTAGALGAGLVKRGYRVLLVDLDPQGNLSDNFGADIYELPTVYNLIKNECVVNDVIQVLENVEIIPANIMLASAEQELHETGKEYRLKEKIAPVVRWYDYCIIDTPPSLGILTINALTAADEVIIPTTADIFEATGIKQLYNTIQNVKRYCNPKLMIAGILITRFNPRTNIGKSNKELTEQLAGHMKSIVFKTYIRNSVVIEEAQLFKKDIFSYRSKSTVANDYNSFIDEYLKEVL